ncbi:MAG: hypothetical protein M9958_02760 [Chitinophagales bacterium]|nr:hypothetical protein [Chitinophagales bacterium]
MKKLFYSFFLLFSVVTFTTSCQKDAKQVVQESLGARLAKDAEFSKMMNATVGMATSFTGQQISAEDGKLAMEILAKGNKANASELAFLKRTFGANFEAFGANLNEYLVAVGNLENTYKLSALTQPELDAAIQGAVELNPALKQKLTAVVSANGKSAGADICNLVVNLASLFGGGALCTAIGVSTIPVVGGVLCTALLAVAKGILGGLCNLIP